MKHERGQALVEYTLIAFALFIGFLGLQAALGSHWKQFIDSIGVYSIYTASFDAILSLPFP